MSDKSYVTMEQHRCLVCGQDYDTGSILIDRRLKNSFDRYTVTGTGLCPEHKKLHEDGFVALVEADPAKSNDPRNPYRTGRIAHIKEEAFDRVFNIPARTDGKLHPMCYIDTEAFDKIVAMTEKHHEPTA